MKIKDLKALARERLLGNYTKLAVAGLLQTGLVVASLLTSLLFLFFGFLAGGIGSLSGRQSSSGGGSAVWAGVFLFLAAAVFLFTVLLRFLLSCGYASLVLKTGREEKAESTEILRFFYTGEHPWKVLGTTVLKQCFIAANALLPGMVYACGTVCRADFTVHTVTNIWYMALVTVSAASLFWACYLCLAFSFAEFVMIEDSETDILDALRKSMELTKKKKLRLIWLYMFSFLFWSIPLMIVPVTKLWILPYMEMTVILFYRECVNTAAKEEIQEIPAEIQKTPEED